MEETLISHNKRAERRYKLDFCFDISSDDFKIQARIKDISCGGIFCQIDKFIPLKTKLNVKMDIPLFFNRKRIENTIKCAAEVVRIDPLMRQSEGKYNLGIRFSDVSEDDKAMIVKFVKQRNLSEAREIREMFRGLKKMVDDLTSLEEAHLKAEHFRRVLNQAIEELESVACILDVEIEELKHLN
ncbi:MAG: PilZ domain-containing protein [Candidatus Omnitrophica bacterium]|nr:PilZ domain-containing protein [Candidatus Omnitrophota bacterium]